jgi:hypothetical protein
MLAMIDPLPPLATGSYLSDHRSTAPLAAKPTNSFRPVAGLRRVGKPRGSSPPARTGLRCGSAVVLAVPVRVPVEPLDPIVSRRESGQTGREAASSNRSIPSHRQLVNLPGPISGIRGVARLHRSGRSSGRPRPLNRTPPPRESLPSLTDSRPLTSIIRSSTVSG